MTPYLTPSNYREVLPTVIVATIAMGRPVITTDTIGCREAVRDGDNGRLIPPRDPAALVSTITQLLGDPLAHKHMGKRGREREFATPIVAQSTLHLYASLSTMSA